MKPRSARYVGGLVDLASRQAIDDAGLVAVRTEEIQQLALAVVLLHHVVADVGPVEGADEPARLIQLQALGDLALGRRIGGGGQGDARHFGPALVEYGQFAVFAAEIVAPLRYAMRFVDGEQGNRRPVQQGQETRRQQAFRGYVEQVQFAGQQGLLDPGGGIRVQGRIEELGAHAELAQCFHLVLHQRDQRRDHHAHAVAQQRRHLVAQRLAAAGRHQHQRVAAFGDVFDDRLLRAAEIGVSEDPVQQFLG